jgi:hypothetical protein
VRHLYIAQEERRSKGTAARRPSVPQGCAVAWWLRTQGIDTEQAAQTTVSPAEAFTRFPNRSIGVVDECDLRTRPYHALMTLGIQDVVVRAESSSCPATEGSRMKTSATPEWEPPLLAGPMDWFTAEVPVWVQRRGVTPHDIHVRSLSTPSSIARVQKGW